MTDRVLLVRHTAVALGWRGRCYGRTDVGLSRVGLADARRRAVEIAAWRPTVVVHSGLIRTRILAQFVSDIAQVACRADSAWRERDFGSWEGRRWSAIHRETGDAMDGMIDAPATFRPGGGETTTELGERAMCALGMLPPGRVVVVAHGGPIAAIRGLQSGLEPRDWLALVPSPGGAVENSAEPARVAETWRAIE